MNNLTEKLEAYRLRNHLSKTEMAEIFELSGYQVYKSWLDRQSVPKAYVQQAEQLVRSDTEEGVIDYQLRQELEGLSATELRLVLAHVRKIRRSKS